MCFSCRFSNLFLPLCLNHKLFLILHRIRFLFLYIVNFFNV
ncbi:hypothetical protein CoNPh26_CDS0154 [Staphylococcus phage S-CoN_Ph26]|nr:hypothetical protein CoNPh26_CDS0154 [Staphylococcus phage S-CoN_Ph26]